MVPQWPALEVGCGGQFPYLRLSSMGPERPVMVERSDVPRPRQRHLDVTWWESGRGWSRSPREEP